MIRLSFSLFSSFLCVTPVTFYGGRYQDSFQSLDEADALQWKLEGFTRSFILFNAGLKPPQFHCERLIVFRLKELRVTSHHTRHPVINLTMVRQGFSLQIRFTSFFLVSFSFKGFPSVRFIIISVQFWLHFRCTLVVDFIHREARERKFYFILFWCRDSDRAEALVAW